MIKVENLSFQYRNRTPDLWASFCVLTYLAIAVTTAQDYYSLCCYAHWSHLLFYIFAHYVPMQPFLHLKDKPISFGAYMVMPLIIAGKSFKNYCSCISNMVLLIGNLNRSHEQFFLDDAPSRNTGVYIRSGKFVADHLAT